MSTPVVPGNERGWALAARSCQAAAMVGAMVLLTLRYEIELQALFFVFLSLAALVPLGDLGLVQAVVPTASHLAADGGAARIAAFTVQARRLNGALCLVAILLTGALGAWLFNSRAADAAWLGPWLATLLALLAFQAANLELALLEAARSPAQAWRWRLIQEVAGGVGLLFALAAGAGLWSIPLYWGLRAAVALVPVRSRLDVTEANGPPVRWRQDVWPFQWRLGLSALAGFFVFQAFNPILLWQLGPAAAAQFGLSLAVMNMLLMATSAWPQSQSALYAVWQARGQHAAARQAFIHTLWASCGLALGAALAVWTLHALMSAGPWLWWQRMSARLVDSPTLAALLLLGVTHHAVMSIAVLLRARRQEPLLGASVVGAVATVLATILAARYGGSLFAVALANLACALGGLTYATVLYKRLVRPTS